MDPSLVTTPDVGAAGVGGAGAAILLVTGLFKKTFGDTKWGDKALPWIPLILGVAAAVAIPGAAPAGATILTKVLIGIGIGGATSSMYDAGKRFVPKKDSE